jgi:16S rRNA (guanine527-N7)-methyltransferase
VNDERESLAVRLRDLVATAGVPVEDGALAQWSDYYELLARWNKIINLTGLPLAGYPPKTLDRLFLEPLLASRYIPYKSADWLDVGSGGGSPAIPLKILRPQLRLLMTEPRARKAAFLREVVRALALEHSVVLEVVAEDVPAKAPSGFAFITVRGVRLDKALADSLGKCLIPGGRLLSFGSRVPAGSDAFVEVEQSSLRTIEDVAGDQSRLFLYEPA